MPMAGKPHKKENDLLVIVYLFSWNNTCSEIYEYINEKKGQL